MVRRNEFRSKRKRKGVIEFKNNKTVKERERVGVLNKIESENYRKKVRE